MKRETSLIPLLLLTVIALGCAGKPDVPEGLVPVQGLVTLDKAPLPGVVVTFCPESGEGPTASGISDQQGRFRLTCFPAGDGAKPGKYKVIVIRSVAGEYAPEPSGASTPAGMIIPPAYGAPTTTPLTITVPVEGELVLDLKGKP